MANSLKFVNRFYSNRGLTPAPEPFTISQNTIGGTYVLLDENYIVPNETKTVEVYANGVLNNTITNAIKGGVYAVNLDELTNYDIYLVIEGNQSNTINVTTTTTPALFQNAVAYYKLDETSGDAIDVVNGYNGTLFGGVTQGVAGKIGTAYSFDGTSGYVSLPDNNNFSFTDGTNDTPFTLRCWLNLNNNSTQMIFGKAKPNALEYYFRIVSGKISLQLFKFDDPLTSIFKRKDTVSDVIINEWMHIVVAYDGVNIKIYRNGIEELTTEKSSGTYTGMNNTNTNVQISRNKFVNSQFINGKLDELVVIKGEAWDLAKVSEDYNNGLGTTI